MTKQDVINYVVETPTNTNKAVLSDLLDEFAVGDNKQEIELSATENKVYIPDNGKVYKKVTVNVPASASDFSTAEVTITASDHACAWIPIIYDYSSDYSSIGEVIVVTVIDKNYSSGTVTVPLYKGKTMLLKDNAFFADNSVTVTGNATYEPLSGQYGDVYAIIITGDCTITIS